ncbi:MAG: glycosyltransferase family 4 protein [Planctomycetes bacterium]|nr:glycosyltransferase family 4 protein [Planctomycetota bacterium]
MKIVFVTYRYWPAVGGVEKYMHRLSQAMIAKGHEVDLVCAAHEGGLPECEAYEGVRIHRFPAHRSPLRCWVSLMQKRSLFKQADVIHISDTLVLEYFYRMLAWTMPNKPLFLTRHGMSYEYPVPAEQKARARRTLNLVDGIVHDGLFIEPMLGVKPDCVPDQGLFPEADDIEDVPEPPPTSATFVGRLEPDSAIDVYVDAIRVLRDVHQMPIRLDVYGDGTLRLPLERKATQQNLPITFHGWQAGAQERITDGCFAFIAGRMAIQESMARKRLVVAAYKDPLKDLYVNGEPFGPWLVSGGDAEAIAKHVAYYANHNDERRNLVDQAYAHARTLSWSKTADAYLQLWSQAPRRQERLHHNSFTAKIKFARRVRNEAKRSDTIST